jgi:hypothetical protein
MGRVGDYINARVNAFTDNVQEVARRIQDNGIIETLIELGVSGLGLLPDTRSARTSPTAGPRPARY